MVKVAKVEEVVRVVDNIRLLSRNNSQHSTHPPSTKLWLVDKVAKVVERTKTLYRHNSWHRSHTVPSR
jgi:hypothetical protein